MRGDIGSDRRGIGARLWRCVIEPVGFSRHEVRMHGLSRERGVGRREGGLLRDRARLRDAQWRGFSLIELLVCITIIAVLIAILLPALKASKAHARSVVCLTRLRALHVSVRVYTDAYASLPVKDQDSVIEEFELPRQSWQCLSDPLAKGQARFSSYKYIAPIYMDPPPEGLVPEKLKPKEAVKKYERNPLLPLYWDKEAWHSKDRNVVYWNGSASRRAW